MPDAQTCQVRFEPGPGTLIAVLSHLNALSPIRRLLALFFFLGIALPAKPVEPVPIGHVLIIGCDGFRSIGLFGSIGLTTSLFRLKPPAAWIGKPIFEAMEGSSSTVDR